MSGLCRRQLAFAITFNYNLQSTNCNEIITAFSESELRPVEQLALHMTTTMHATDCDIWVTDKLTIREELVADYYLLSIYARVPFNWINSLFTHHFAFIFFRFTIGFVYVLYGDSAAIDSLGCLCDTNSIRQKIDCQRARAINPRQWKINENQLNGMWTRISVKIWTFDFIDGKSNKFESGLQLDGTPLAVQIEIIHFWLRPIHFGFVFISNHGSCSRSRFFP